MADFCRTLGEGRRQSGQLLHFRFKNFTPTIALFLVAKLPINFLHEIIFYLALTVPCLYVSSGYAEYYFLNCSLGLLHDGSGQNKNCPDGINVMASGNTRGGEGFVWSKCSSNVLERSLL